MASTSDTSTTSIIKSDRIGRSRYSSKYKAEVLAAYSQSGKNIKYARHTIKYARHEWHELKGDFI